MKILIVKTSSLGDIIQSFSAVALIKKHDPEAEIDWVAEKPFCELLESHPSIHRVIPIEARKWKKGVLKNRRSIGEAFSNLRKESYDLLYDLQGNIKSGLITFFAKAKKKVGYTFSSAPEWPASLFLSKRHPVDLHAPIAQQYLSLIQRDLNLPNNPVEWGIQLHISSEEEKWINRELREVSKPCFMICMGSQWENKKLSLPCWREFLEKLEGKFSPYFFFVWGSEKEKVEAETLQAAFPERSRVLPRMRLPVWQRFMERMDHILTVDSGALHLAATTSTPTFSIFGPSQAEVYGPLGKQHQTFQGSCPYGVSFDKRCPKLRTCKTGACLKGIASSFLLENFTSID
jgi:heptosyltransferase-1